MTASTTTATTDAGSTGTRVPSRSTEHFDPNDLTAYSNHNAGVMTPDVEALHSAIKRAIGCHWAISYGVRTDEVVMRGISWDVIEALHRAGFHVERTAK